MNEIKITFSHFVRIIQECEKHINQNFEHKELKKMFNNYEFNNKMIYNNINSDFPEMNTPEDFIIE